MQILIDSFEIGGIVHYGTAGSANDSLSFGDVSVPIHLAFTASWKWKVNYLNSLSKKFFILVFGFLPPPVFFHSRNSSRKKDKTRN